MPKLRLEIKRTSITRLKQIGALLRVLKRCVLEIKRTSITRLKPREPPLTANRNGSRSWNQKNLDYEIETILWVWTLMAVVTWNQKNLDYEIETAIRDSCAKDRGKLEIKRTSITRLKPAAVTPDAHPSRDLKSKEPRLRDWNNCVSGRNVSVTSAWNQKNLDYEIETRL